MQVLFAHTESKVGNQPISGDDMELGARIRKARERLGVSITDLGLAFGKNRQAVQFWENGKHFPPLSDFGRLCRMLRADANYFLGMGVMDVLTEQEAAKARLEIESAAARERTRREEAASKRPARRGLQRSTGQTGRFRRPA
jgi:transcriptional regulator with XRE-family HTH domain